MLTQHSARLAILALPILLLAGCPFNGPQSPADPKLVPFASESDLLDYFNDRTAAATRQRNLETVADSGGAPGDDQATGDEAFSTTNLQEMGVDESDVLKSDGTYFYIAADTAVRVVRAAPVAELAAVASLDLGDRVDALYLLPSENLLLALSTAYGGWGLERPEILSWPPYYTRSTSTVHQIDISDPAAPAVVRSVELDGVIADSRLIGTRLTLILTVLPDLPEPNQAVELEDVMPQIRSETSAATVANWDQWLRPANPDGYAMTAVITLNATDIDNSLGSTVVLANAGTIYASTESLYLTDTDYNVAADLREQTIIHKFTFDDDGVANYVASGQVPGRLLNQFSLDEQDGILRVATHVAAWSVGIFGEPAGVDVAVAAAPGADGGAADDTAQASNPTTPPYNAVFTLAEAGEDLEIQGSVLGIAPGERIYSARFLVDHGFLVTFRQIDPLFVLDLADPASPQVVGELKVPGYSDYLHPLGTDRLIGVGRSADDGFPDALQISLFDVSDWTAPTAITQETIGGYGSYADASYTHKAFTLIERGGETLLALPAVVTSETNPFISDDAFRGVLCFTVDSDTGFAEMGRLATLDAGETWWLEHWRRAAFIGDQLYTVTPTGVRTAPLDDLTSDATVSLTD
jgi:uncharacterized secreted protein with C-terminal beta-propeller domain